MAEKEIAPFSVNRKWTRPLFSFGPNSHLCLIRAHQRHPWLVLILTFLAAAIDQPRGLFGTLPGSISRQWAVEHSAFGGFPGVLKPLDAVK